MVLIAIMALCRAYAFAEVQQVPFVLTYSIHTSHLNTPEVIHQDACMIPLEIKEIVKKMPDLITLKKVTKTSWNHHFIRLCYKS